MPVQYRKWGFRSFVGYEPVGLEAFAPPPLTAFTFLLDNDLIGATHLGTIDRLLGWGRENQVHWGGPAGGSPLDQLPTKTFEVAWGYRGRAPVATMMKKYIVYDPFLDVVLYQGTPHAISRGCWAETTFLQSILRAVNIPVHDTVAGTHSAVYFPTVDRALSHSDDPMEAMDLWTKLGMKAAQLGYCP